MNRAGRGPGDEMCALYHFLENEEGEQERKGGCPSGGGGEQVRKEEGGTLWIRS